MTNERFDDLVWKLERQARCRPLAYRFKVFLLAFFGKAYVGVILVLLAALLAALLVSMLTLGWLVVGAIAFVGAFFFSAVAALCVKVDPPAATEVTIERAPELFAMIDELRSKVCAPRCDHVLITDELNAGVFESPRIGVFGWYRSFLLIGLPLMKALTCEQLKAVLAHEFGHHGKRHGRFSHSIYRQRLRWTRLITELETTESKGSVLFGPFLNWFVPYFSAFSFPLARANEYEADAISVRLTSSRAAAEALTSIEVVGGYLSDFYWPVIDAEFGEKPQPTRKPYSEMSDVFAARLDKATGQIWVEPAMARQTTLEDTHPALRERLRAIGEEPSFSPPEPGRGADGLLGPSLEGTTKALEGRWKEKVLSAWEKRHKEIQEGRRRLRELNEKHASRVELTLEDRIERAELTESIGKSATGALEQWRALHESASDNARICFALGSHLLMRNDEIGCALVKRALQVDEDAILQGCELLCDYYCRNGQEEEYHAWNTLLIEEAEVQELSKKERSRVSLTNNFEPHGLPKETLAAFVAQLRAIPGLRTVYFLRKRVLFYPHRPLYVLGYRVMGANTRAEEVLARIKKSVQFVGETFIINVDRDNRFRRKFGRMRQARILYVSRPDSIVAGILKKIFGILAVSLGILALFVFSIDISKTVSMPHDILLFLVVFCCTTIVVGVRWLRDPID